MTNYIWRPIRQKATRRLAAICGTMLVGIACSLGLASQASALAFSEGDQYFLGYINPDIPSDPADATSYINHLITLALNDSDTFSGQTITRSGETLCSPSCPTATTTNDVTNTTGNNTGDFGSGFQYLLAKYDADKGGALVWFVDGLTGSFTVPQNFGDCGNGDGCGLSHFDLYNPGPGDPGPGTTQEVPEPTSMLLLGSGVMLVNLVGRRIRRRSK